MDFLKKMCAAPVERRGTRLLVVVDDPLDPAHTDALRSIDPEHEPLFLVGLRDEILACIDYSYGLRGDSRPVETAVQGVEEAGRPDRDSRLTGGPPWTCTSSPTAPLTAPSIRMRVGGRFEPFEEVPPGLAAALTAHFKGLAGLEVVERQRPQEGSSAFRLPDRTLKLRVTTVPTVHGNEDAAMRLLGAGKPITLDERASPGAR